MNEDGEYDEYDADYDPRNLLKSLKRIEDQLKAGNMLAWLSFVVTSDAEISDLDKFKRNTEIINAFIVETLGLDYDD